MKLEMYDEMDGRMNFLIDVIQTHLGKNHPVLVTIFEEIGDFFNQFVNEENSCVNFYTQVGLNI